MAVTTTRHKKKHSSHKTSHIEILRVGVLCLGSLLLGYFVLLWAFETGSLWVYAIVFILFAVAAKFLLKSVRLLLSSVRK